ncbi:23031_t:CDS:10 [Gigaspora margarita]|uniref:malate dehydrogenase n=1 Tax=Gigaspora margarita TaxID=4874 RepID=A0ABN7UVJ8_GIGMA|nr:23031_t:CDS:10 [Gigaspora margarita]
MDNSIVGTSTMPLSATHFNISERIDGDTPVKLANKNGIKTTDIIKINQKKYERKVKKVKLSARSELDIFEWSKCGFANNNYWISPDADKLPRIDVSQVSREDFIMKYEEPVLPVVITGCTKDWAAETKWNKEELLRNYARHKFKIGEDDKGNPVRMTFKYYMYYLETEGFKDDSPLYIFDSSFGRRGKPKKANVEELKRKNLRPKSKECLLKDYKVPTYFDDDLFRFTGENRRPPYRWFILGGERSGTGIHSDPLGTSAWNTLLVGHKRWCLFPPSTPRKLIDPKQKDHEAVTWFTCVLPKLLEVHEGRNKSLAEEYGMIEALQRPGETMFVPGGWYHVVMNLDFTIAVTQNFCSPTSIEQVWLRTRNARPKLAQKLLSKIIRFEKSSTDDDGDTEVSETESEEDGADVRRLNVETAKRAFSSSAANATKVAVLGAAGGIGQPLALTLKQNELISHLSLYDIVNGPGVAADLDHIDIDGKVTGYTPDNDGLKHAITDATIIVIPAGVPRKPGMTRDDLFNTNAGIVRDLANAAAQYAPKAHMAIISNPVNSTVPIVSEIFKKHKVYDPKSTKKEKITVVGGHSGVTIIPLLSQTSSNFTDDELKALTHRIQFGGDEVVKAKAGSGSATLSMSYAAARFVNSLLRALKGESGIIEPAYVRSPLFESKGLEYFASNVELCHDGVGKIHDLGPLNQYEKQLLEAALPELKKNIAKGVDFVHK